MTYTDSVRFVLECAGAITNRQVSRMTGLDPVSTAKMLGKMKDQGDIESVRRGVWRATRAMKWCG